MITVFAYKVRLLPLFGIGCTEPVALKLFNVLADESYSYGQRANAQSIIICCLTFGCFFRERQDERPEKKKVCAKILILLIDEPKSEI
jgi:hypothetical protein